MSGREKQVPQPCAAKTQRKGRDDTFFLRRDHPDGAWEEAVPSDSPLGLLAGSKLCTEAFFERGDDPG